MLGEHDIETFIEIGPSDTLVSMAKKTIASRFKNRDSALSTQRRLLYYKKNAKEIRYDVDEPPESETSTNHAPPTTKETEPAIADPAKTAVVGDVAVSLNAPAQRVEVVATLAVTSQITDCPTTAKEIVAAIVAQKLKKPFNEVEMHKSVKLAAGGVSFPFIKRQTEVRATFSNDVMNAGRSALENEMIGDIGAVFKSLPERAEELELDNLCVQLECLNPAPYSLNKTTNTLIGRIFSLKMPGGFGIAVARKHLESRWGLGQGRQNSVFLRASTMQPAVRLGSISDAEAFFDGIAKQYLVDNNLSGCAEASQPTGSASNIVTSTLTLGEAARAPIVHEKIPSATALETKANIWRKLERKARYSGIDIKAVDRANVQSRKSSDKLRQELDHLHTELGSTFISGIKPLWAAAKVRRYDSYWNWAAQDLLHMIHSILLGRTKYEDVIRQNLIHIINRSDNRLIKMLRYLRVTNVGQVRELVTGLLAQCESTTGSPHVLIPYVDLDAVQKAPCTMIDPRGEIQYQESPRSAVRHVQGFALQTRAMSGWSRNERLSDVYENVMSNASEKGFSFHRKNVLVTGASRGSICAEVLRLLLQGGARIVVTTSSYSAPVLEFFQGIYTSEGARGSQLVVIPFNQGSVQDIQNLIEYIYSDEDGLGWDLDHVLPFAAISEAGRELDGIDSKSELAHRIMLTNLLRLIGEIKKTKQAKGLETRPTQILVPLSPNHGIFGNDGLYAESKIALETLFNKWHSEHWSAYLSLCGVIIGWTRGTSLMASNDIVAAGLESKGIRTFSQAEMAFYIVSLMQSPIVVEGEVEPIKADLTGDLNGIDDLRSILNQLRKEIKGQSEEIMAIEEERTMDDICINGAAPRKLDPPTKLPKSNIHLDFPTLPDYEDDIEPLSSSLNGMADLESVVVVTGFSEVGPYGNARTRWQMEAEGTFSLEGCIEMAWMMGLIKHHNGKLNGKHYIGWIDAKSSQPVPDHDVKVKYEEHILAHTGIRLTEPDLQDGFDPNKQQFYQEIILEEDMPPITVSKETADQVKHEHGEFADIFEVEEGEEWRLYLRKGATMIVPKALNFNRSVVGQIPTGWDARTYGIDDSTINQVDRVTLFALISTVEALQASGIVDPYELYKYLHVSEIGNCIGSGLGGTQSLKKMFRSRYMDKPVQNDILQETFINTTAAWVNMLLLSSSGPIRTSVGACATSIESLETGYETIVTKKAKLCLVGGGDDYGDSVAYEFANMNATSDATKELSKGREPKQMSRPMASSRSGFLESQGCGIQVLTSARFALDLGLPIYGVIAWAGTSSDKIGRSVPAAGQGVLVNARECGSRGLSSPLLNIHFRRKRLSLREQHIKEYLDTEIALAKQELAALSQGEIASGAREALIWRMKYVTAEAKKQLKATRLSFGNNFWVNEPTIAPIRGALAVWGLTIDDIDFVSLHGTSTVMNDKNETSVIQQQLSHLGRKPGNTVYAIAQKYLTGHSKGAAGAWMLNGALQALDSGLIPGNRNADNIDAALAQHESIVFPNRSIQTTGLKAFSLTSFGFGQKGAQAIGVHPRYLYAVIGREEYEAYRDKTERRGMKASRHFQRAIATNTMFVAKQHAPYTDAQQAAVLLNPLARARAAGEEFQFGDQDGFMEDEIKGLL